MVFLGICDLFAIFVDSCRSHLCDDNAGGPSRLSECLASSFLVRFGGFVFVAGELAIPKELWFRKWPDALLKKGDELYACEYTRANNTDPEKIVEMLEDKLGKLFEAVTWKGVRNATRGILVVMTSSKKVASEVEKCWSLDHEKFPSIMVLVLVLDKHNDIFHENTEKVLKYKKRCEVEWRLGGESAGSHTSGGAESEDAGGAAGGAAGVTVDSNASYTAITLARVRVKKHEMTMAQERVRKYEARMQAKNKKKQEAKRRQEEMEGYAVERRAIAEAASLAAETAAAEASAAISMKKADASAKEAVVSAIADEAPPKYRCTKCKLEFRWYRECFYHLNSEGHMNPSQRNGLQQRAMIKNQRKS